MKAAPFVVSIAVLVPATVASAEEPPTAVAQAQPTEATPAPTEAAPVTDEVPAAEPTPAPTSVEVPAEPTQEEAPAASSITINGFVSGAYVFNLNDPLMPSVANTLRIFDFNDNTFSLDVAELVVQKAVGEPGSLGFRVDLTLGSTLPPVAASAGQFPELQQAYVSYVLAGSSKLRLDAGKFITHMGLEVLEGYDGWNDNYSRSLLFGWAIPFTHTGIKASLPLSDTLSGTLMLVNGWDNGLDANEAPSVGLQLAYSGGPSFVAYLNYIGGPEGTEKGDLRHVVDVVLMTSMDKLSLALNADFGTDASADDATWFGVAAYGKYALSDAFSLALRGEYFVDSDGFRTGTEQNVFEVTLTPSYTVAPGFVVRGEARFDKSDEAVFATDDMADPSDSQLTLAVNALASF